MSKLTNRLLCGIDYNEIREKRVRNFSLAHQLYSTLNIIDPTLWSDDTCVPMVYPLVVRDSDLVKKLIEKQIYTGRWWNSVINSVPENSVESMLSKYMVPIPIDQRYGVDEIRFVSEAVKSIINI